MMRLPRALKTYPKLSAAVIAVGVLAASCQTTSQTPTSNERLVGYAACCRSPEKFPAWMQKLAQPIMPVAGPIVGRIVWRKGYLMLYNDARAEIRRNLKPLDILIVRSEARWSSSFIPGYFNHAIIYLGNKSQLKSLGMWNDPAIRPYRKALEQGEHFVEADTYGIHLSDEGHAMDADEAIVLRHVYSPAKARNILRGLFHEVGGKYDYKFDLSSKDDAFCTELVYRYMPELRAPTHKAYSYDLVLPDDYVALAAKRSSALRAVVFVESRRTGWNAASMKKAIGGVVKYWRETPRHNASMNIARISR